MFYATMRERERERKREREREGGREREREHGLHYLKCVYASMQKLVAVFEYN